MIKPFSVLLLLLLASTLVEGQYCSLSASAGDRMNQNQRLSKTTGVSLVDLQLNRELGVLSTAFGVRPGFFILDDGDAPNAFAMPNILQPGTDSTVVFGYTLMTTEFRNTQPGSLNYTISAIMAHEFSHLVQFRNGSSLSGPEKEKQADYLAGWYMGNRQHFSRNAMQEMITIMQAFFSKGDTNFFSPAHHGTPEERAELILRGAQDFQAPLPLAYQRSIALVSDTEANGQNRRPSRRAVEQEDDDSVSHRRKVRKVEDQNDARILSDLIILAKDNDFRSIRGALQREGDLTRWAATKSLPFADVCSIILNKEDSREWYSCSIGSYNNETDAKDKVDGTINFILEDCPACEKGQARDRSSSRRIDHIRYVKTGEQGIRIGIEYEGRNGSGFEVSLTIFPLINE